MGINDQIMKSITVLVLLFINISNNYEFDRVFYLDVSFNPGICDCNWDPITTECWKDRGDSYCFAEKMGPSGICDA